MDIVYLDGLTGGAFTAPTSGERVARVRDWLQSSPGHDQLSMVCKELSVKDKGAAKLVREKLDDAKRTKGQETLVAEWVARAQTLLQTSKLNIADAMAWQRDAAKAGAPLSKEPLALLKGQLADRVRVIEDLQHRVQVQREAAVLLAQRIEVLSTKPWRDAQAALDALQGDVKHWQLQAAQLIEDSSWLSVDAKFPPFLDASKGQLLVVWEAFQAALTLAVVAAQDAAAILPPVPVWADELRVARGVAPEVSPRLAKPKIDPQVRAGAVAAVREMLGKLEVEIAQGHGKASAGAADALRQALKEFGRLVDDKLEHQAQSALAAAGELEGWQRWRADQLREELIAKAQGLLKRPEGQAIGGRKMQESLRMLRDQWKLTDQGGVPNHAMWKRFDEACNEAYQVVEAWLDKVKTEAVENKAQRLALIEEVNAWAQANQTALDNDWKGFNRILYQFGDRWRDGGHLGEKAFAELQPLWKAAISKAAAPLEALQAQSLIARQAMIEEAKALGDAPVLHMDAVKALQQRWQTQAHMVPMDRRQEQKLWDAFRKPIDDAFNRKAVEREKAEASLGVRDRMVLDAAKALEAANAKADAKAIRAAMSALDAALHGQAQAQADVKAAGAQENAAKQMQEQVHSSAEKLDGNQGISSAEESSDATNIPVLNALIEESSPHLATLPAPAVVPKPAPKPVVAMRGDDRPGMKKEAPAANAKSGNRKDGGGRAGRDGKAGPSTGVGQRGAGIWSNERASRGNDSAQQGHNAAWQETPRLGDAAFRAQRDALENAQMALRSLAAQAHGEALIQLLTAWEKRDSGLVPNTQDLGSKISATARAAWVQALGDDAKRSSKGGVPVTDPQTALLRLEMAAETPTPIEHISARRALQLQLLTKRNDPTPIQTWPVDVAAVLQGEFDASAARRLQNVMKVLLKR
jgi:ATP-dependent RNA helicase SUPV3L1/SUV3